MQGGLKPALLVGSNSHFEFACPPVGRNKPGRAKRWAGVSGKTGRLRRKHHFSLTLEEAYSGLRQCAFRHQNPGMAVLPAKTRIAGLWVSAGQPHPRLIK